MSFFSRLSIILLMGAAALFTAKVSAAERDQRACNTANRTIAGGGLPDSTGSARPMTIAKTPAEVAKEQKKLADDIWRAHRSSHPYAIGERDYYRDKMLSLLIERGIVRSSADLPTQKTDAELIEWLSEKYAQERFAQSIERDVQRRLKDLTRAGVVNDKNQPPSDPAELATWVDSQHKQAIKDKKIDPAKSPSLLEEMEKQYNRFTSRPQKFESKEQLADAVSTVLSRSSSLMTAAVRSDSWQLGRQVFARAVRENPNDSSSQKYLDALDRDAAYVRNATGVRTPIWVYVDPKATFPQKDVRRGAMEELSAAVAQRVADETGYDPSFVRFVMNRFDMTETGGGRISPLLDVADNGSLGFLGGRRRD
ncbi:MAG: hypothetical protein H6617_03040 [Bdellovibrionaceae bacterium]|nr:hypothetical protein [Bdellovibrionales bacterium]MCB9253635.1 hypothetical protein [Pseudobdellovibrionaceae bacterium]